MGLARPFSSNIAVSRSAVTTAPISADVFEVLSKCMKFPCPTIFVGLDIETLIGATSFSSSWESDKSGEGNDVWRLEAFWLDERKDAIRGLKGIWCSGIAILVEAQIKK